MVFILINNIFVLRETFIFVSRKTFFSFYTKTVPNLSKKADGAIAKTVPKITG